MPGSRLLEANPDRVEVMMQQMEQAPYLLDRARRAIVLTALHEVCRHRHWIRRAATSVVARRPRHAVNHHNRNRQSPVFELQAKLRLHSRKKCHTAGAFNQCLRRPFNHQVPGTIKARLVNHAFVDVGTRNRRQFVRELRHCQMLTGQKTRSSRRAV